MVAKAIAKFVRVSPQKARLVIDMIRGSKVSDALVTLTVVNKKAAFILKKVLVSATANAKNKGYDESKLFVSKVVADGGPTLRRWRAATFGRATTIRKRTSHIKIELDTSEKIIDAVKVK
ncbi:MAG: 50S ribosomal protein L22 [Candidatus Omnitrophica bacterium]|nr:50S ribosomal protein L22 [Candidatus Omnitrophota bacterium]